MTALLLQLHAQHNMNLADAVQALASKPLGITVVLLFAVVLSAVITQAFSFEAIRLLEGYWGGNRVSAMFLRSRVNVHRKRRQELLEKIKRQRLAAFELARSHMWSASIKPALIEVIEDDFFSIADEDRRQHPATIVNAARQMDWRPQSSPSLLDALDRSVQRLADYPPQHRVLPTKLGNVLRAREDRIRDDGGELEGLVMRRYERYERIPVRLMTQHDQFRNRLDMYCTLALVILLLAVLARRQDHYISAGIVCVIFLLLSFISYLAAIASARGYGVVLSAIAAQDETPSP